MAFEQPVAEEQKRRLAHGRNEVGPAHVRSAAQVIPEQRGEEGIKVGLFRPITLWPSPAKKLKEIGKKFDKILVAELNLGQYLEEIQRVTLRDDFKTLLKANGRPLSPSEIIEKVKEF